MFDNIGSFFRKIMKTEPKQLTSKDAAKERLHLVLMQDRANVSADFLELMKQEIINVIKKYIDIDEKSIDVRLTNQQNNDGTNGAPALYANIPIVNIKSEIKLEKAEEQIEEQEKTEIKKENEDKKEEIKEEKAEELKEETVEAKANDVKSSDEEKQEKEDDDDVDVPTFDELLKQSEEESKKEEVKEKENQEDKKTKSEKKDSKKKNTNQKN